MKFSGLLNSRLSRRIVSSVFFCIVAIEGVLFIPAYAYRERELLQQLETLSAEVLTTVKVDVMTDVASDDLLDRGPGTAETRFCDRGGHTLQP